MERTFDMNKKMIALTFDDGPSEHTAEIIECLKNNDAKATFFLCGERIDANEDAVRKALEIGCQLGNHTFTHKVLSQMPVEEMMKELEVTDAKIKEISGENAVVMRPPEGRFDDSVAANVGKPMILWEIDTRDWSHQDTDKTIKAVLDNVQDGDIVLMHDSYESTKKASLTLIPQLRKDGYELLTISELAAVRGYELENGVPYHNFRKK